MSELKELLNLAIDAAQKASEVILSVYNSGDFQAEVKGDNSPLTIADKKAHHVIESVLKLSQLPILSEEGRSIPYEERRHWKRFWMVDPLDGTKEFLKRNGEFTVNIALIDSGKPVLGVVNIPVEHKTVYAAAGSGVWLKTTQALVKLPLRERIDLSAEGLRVVASRSHMSDETQSFIASLKNSVLVSKGSSLKFLLLAEGKADVYPRLAPTMEWDTAAAHALINEAGLAVYKWGTNTELEYNKEDLLNPYFLVR